MSAVDEFPEMPSKVCSTCRKEKKIMFFARSQSSCRMCDAAQNAKRVTPNPVPGTVVLFGGKPLRRNRK